MKTIKMNSSGNRPDIGHWEAGAVLTIPADAARMLVACKAGKEVKPKDKPAPGAAKKEG
ncbi:MAG: hypothetical protein ACE5GY_07080 [Thermodesulfobacteriota bacterium]